jgi:hypothetical protein
MVIHKTHQYKILLLMAGYLFIVLNHIYFVELPHKHTGNTTVTNISLIPKGYDQHGHTMVIVKKIFKSIVKRDLDYQSIPLQELYVAKLLYNSSLPVQHHPNFYTYAWPISSLPVKRGLQLRI